MKELEDTHSEVRRIVELQFANWEHPNNASDDDAKSIFGSADPNDATNFMGGFLNDNDYAWLSCGSKLVVFNTKTGVSISTWTFRERISCLSEFPAQPGQIPLLLVGLDNDANKIRDSYGMVCVFDCTISQVLRAVRMPAGVEQLCIVNGGAEWEEMHDERLENILEESYGTAFIALRNLDHYVMDLRRNTWEHIINFPIINESNPADIEFTHSGNTSIRHRPSRERHTVHNLMNERLERFIGFNRDEFESSVLYKEKTITSMTCLHKIASLISGCLGRIIIWQSDGVVRWISSPMEDNMVPTHLVLLEPTDDPRPFCYLWVACQEEAPSSIQPILRMYAMLFEKKYLDKDMNCYSNLEGEPSLKFELKVEEKSRITGLHPIIRENKQEQTESGDKRGEDNLLLINVEGRTILFDLNQWYKEQMPRFIGACQNPNAILSSYQSERRSLEDKIISCAYISSTLKEFPCTTSTTPEELFFPNSLSLEWLELGVKRLTFRFTRGVQAQLLREIAMAGPIIMIQPSETYHRCISAGLVPFNSETSIDNTIDNQRDALLTLCLEQRWTMFLLKCAKEWSNGSAAYLYPAFLRWGFQRASTVQITAHQLCIPLFDQSGTSIGEAEVKTLRFFSQQMECLCNVIENLSLGTGELDHQRRTLRRISTYLQILLWFYDVGLLPETQDVDEESLPIPFIFRIPYPTVKLATIYAEKRKQYRQHSGEEHNEAVMFIDELIVNECSALKSQWEQESNEIDHDGHYPPPSLQSLLRSCLIDCHRSDGNEMENKHQIIIYLLMDLVMLYQGSCPGVDQLIKYPSAFKLSPSLIKLTQALWLLDHEDYQGFLEIMTGQLVLESDIKDWHHKLVMRTLLRSNQNKLALIYIRVRKPPLSSIDDQSTVIHLSVEHGLVHSAFHQRSASHYNQLLTKFFRACKHHGKLNDILHLALNNEEEEAFIQYLDEEKCEETRLLYYLQNSRYNEAKNALPPDQSIVSAKKTSKPASLLMFHAYNSTLPDITRRFSTNLNRRNIEVDAEPRHPRPMSHYRSLLSTRDIHETVVRKARETFIRSDKSQIPFISAPCSSSKANIQINGSNCVLFVERLRKPSIKRTLEEIQEDPLQDNEAKVRKRQKMECDTSRADEIDLNMVGTPLVKKKNQTISVPDGPSETPHSILKIRQMIRDSMSPHRVFSNEDEKPSDTERKPRQIRFSINQLNVSDESISREPPPDLNKSIADDMINLDTTESVKSRSVTPTNNSADEDDEYFSPNTNTKSLSETTVLTDSSSYYSKSLSGPRPRPGLRCNDVNSSFDGVKKFSVQYSTMITDSSPNSARASVDISVTSDIVSSTFIDSHTPRIPHCRPALPSASIYDSTVLSSNTSLELSPHGTPHKCRKVFLKSFSCEMDPEESSTKNDSLLRHSENQEINVIDTTTNFNHTKSTISNTITMDISKDDEKSGNGRIHDGETHAIGESDDVNSDECLIGSEETGEDMNLVSASESVVQLGKNVDKNHMNNDQYVKNELHMFLLDEEKIVNVKDVIDDDTLSVKPSDDYDDELLALKYDDEEEEDDVDDDDVFKSLSNSMERDSSKLDGASRKPSMQHDVLDKTAAGQFYDEFNITDDESSRSIDQSDTIDMVHKQDTRTDVTNSVLSPDASPIYNDVNITDDKTNDSIDFTELSTEGSKDRNMNERTDAITIRNRSSTDEENEVIFQNEHKDTVEYQVAKDSNVTTTSPAQLSSRVDAGVDEQTSTPDQKPRSHQTSPVILKMEDNLLDTPNVPKLGRTRRASSLAKETHSTPILASSTATSVLESSIGSPVVKRGRGRRSTSLMKEVLITSIINEPSLANVIESPLRRSTRRAASVQKDMPVTNSTPTKDSNIMCNILDMGENVTDEQNSGKIKRRNKRATSLSKDIDTKTRNMRSNSDSTAEDDKDVANGPSSVTRKTRATSVSKESMNKSLVKETTTKRTRAASVPKNMTVDLISADVPLARRTRAASVSNESADDPTPKRKRSASLASDVTTELPARRKRAASLTKEIDRMVEGKPGRLTRASSLTKEFPIENETSRKRPTRRKSSTSKDAISEVVKTKKSTDLNDVIPEEVDESIDAAVEGSSQKQTTYVRARNIIKTVIPEEHEGDNECGEVLSDTLRNNEKQRTKKGSTRAQRATSVDLPQTETKSRTRGSAKCVSDDDRNGLEESAEIGRKTKSTRTTRRMTRAASETKELANTADYPLPETIRSSGRKTSGPDDAETYVFSPETKLESRSSTQPRRPISNFIAPLTDGEEEITAGIIVDKSGNSKRTRSSSSMIRVRKKFSFPSHNNIK